MQVREGLQAFFFYNQQHTEATQTWYVSRLTAFETWCERRGIEIEQLTPAIIREYLDELSARPNQHNGKPLSSYTVNGAARCVRRFMNFLEEQEDFQDMVKPKTGRKIPMPKIKVKTIQVFTCEEITRLFAAGEEITTFPWLRDRNRAILSILLDTGIRASELCGLTLDHCYLADPNDAYIKVMGKGSRQREIGLGNKSRASLQHYLLTRRATAGETHVFIGQHYEPLLPNGLNEMLYRLAESAGVEQCHAHVFRHTFAVFFLEKKCGTLHALSKLLGHEEISTTEIYLRTVQSRAARQLSKSVFDEL